MSLKILSKQDTKIITAMAGGIIPRGGDSFEMGAADLEDKWLPRTDYMLKRMNIINRTSLRYAAKFVNYFWPIRYLGKFRPLTEMSEEECTALLHKIENSGFPGSATILIIKVLVFPAFYGLPEVKDAIGYKERFPNSPDFEGIKE